VDINTLIQESGLTEMYQTEYLRKLVENSLDAESFLLPYWLKYPEIPYGSIHWSMGEGEDYMFLYQLYMRCLQEYDKVSYQQKYREKYEDWHRGHVT